MKPRFFNLFTLFALLTSLLGSALTFTPAYAAGFTVNTTNDTTDLSAGDGICADVSVTCSLRAAIEEANALAGADTITVPAGTYTLTLGLQLPAVTTDITINGNGAANTIIQANAAANTATYRIFEVDGTGTLTLDSLTVRHGRCNGACNNVTDMGGGIFNNGALTITNSTLSNNSASNNGGGILNLSTLTITNSTLSSNSAVCGGGMFHTGTSATLTNVTFNANSAGDDGGGVCSNSGNLTLTDVSFNSNTATGEGGGMYTNGGSVLTNVTFSGNSAASGGGMSTSSVSTLTNVTFSGNSATIRGGGMFNNNNAMLTNVTFSANSATLGGGMFNNSGPTLNNVTFSGNSATDGGGMYNTGSGPKLNNVTFSGNSATNDGGGMYIISSSLTMTNVIIANSTSGGDCVNNSGTLNAQNSLIEDGLSCVNGTNTDNLSGDPVLSALANNGGSTQTFALLAGSPAIDTGTNTGCPATDQRGVTRPVDGDAVIGALCDIGAYEYVPSAPPTATFGDVPIDYWAWQYIESIYKAGITGGCSTSPMEYCPTDTVTRAQMAIFLLRGIHGRGYIPPTATGAVFSDVPVDLWSAKWIEQLSAEGITSGCGNGNYCPDAVISRAEMSIFLLRAKYGKDYVPPAANGAIFVDVPAEYWAAGWIEQLLHDGIAKGCGNNSFCPDGNVIRDQMAVFLQKTFNLPLP